MSDRKLWVIITLLLILFIALVTFFIGSAIHRENQSPKIEIIKDEWECTKTENHTVMQTIRQPVVITECVEYRKKEKN